MQTVDVPRNKKKLKYLGTFYQIIKQKIQHNIYRKAKRTPKNIELKISGYAGKLNKKQA